MKAVILAGGKGIRMKPLTDELPKALIEVKGKSFLERQLIELKKAGINEVGIVVGYLKEKIIERFGNEFNGVKIHYFEQKNPLGTADALETTEGFTGKEFIKVNADLLFEAELIKELIAVTGFDAVIVARKTSEPWRYGVLEVKGNQVKGIQEKPEKGTEKSNLINAGIEKFSSKIFEAIKFIQISERNEFELPEAINLLIKNGRVAWIPVKGEFYDIGCIEDLKKAEKKIKI
jgi:NDP-sugar pyrophosphorylase family protein